MATGQQIITVAGGSYPSKVRGGNWLDLNCSVRVMDRAGKRQVICLLDPVAKKAILVGGDEVVSIDDLALANQGRMRGPEITEEALDVLERLLNAVADERMFSRNVDEPKYVQTPNAVAARMLLGIFCMPRQKGLAPDLEAIRKLRV